MAETSANVNLNLIPAMQAPPGEDSNLKDPANMNRFMYLTAGVCLSCSTLAVIFRLFVKARIIRAIQLEEFILSFSLAGLISLTGVMIQSTLMGQGVHQWNVSAAHAQKIVEVGTTAQELDNIQLYWWFSMQISSKSSIALLSWALKSPCSSK